ncbi:MAG: PIN domain-containing protein [Thaumarchaeota archaeon]|nr:PIN domain-containing protein [Nitrososphaerota archaeon]
MIFLDSSFVIALADEDDQYHEKAVKLLAKLHTQRALSELVVSESVSSVGSRLGVKAGRTIFENLMYDSANKTFFANKRLYERTMPIYAKYGGKLSFSDSVSVRLMYDQKIKEIVSFDSDFDHVEDVVRVS